MEGEGLRHMQRERHGSWTGLNGHERGREGGREREGERERERERETGKERERLKRLHFLPVTDSPNTVLHVGVTWLWVSKGFSVTCNPAAEKKEKM